MNKVDKVIEVLTNHEDELSDGYGYYCNPDKKLREIAEEILKDTGD